MNTNIRNYELLAEGKKYQHSKIGAIPIHERVSPNIKKALYSPLFDNEIEVLSVKDTHLLQSSAEKKYEISFLYKGERYESEIAVRKIEDLDLQDFGLANTAEDCDFHEMIAHSEYIEVSMLFGESSLRSFHCQLKLLHIIVPEALMVIDFSTYRILSGKWLKLAAESKIPPSPDYLYVLYAGYEQKNKDKIYWFRTYGLLRCGIVDLEMLNIHSDSHSMYDLVNNVIKRFLSSPVKENEKFTIGFDGLQINLAWIRWEHALSYFPEDILGGIIEREESDRVQSSPAGILFAVEDGNLTSPEIYVSALSNNPILFVSAEETIRMSSLAKERYPYFFRLFLRYRDRQNSSFLRKILYPRDKTIDGWSFWVKIGITIDSPKQDSEKEHLWFTVINVTESTICGQLINDPYWIASLNKGDIGTYPTGMLTDWLISDKEGNQYTPDSIYLLLD